MGKRATILGNDKEMGRKRCRNDLGDWHKTGTELIRLLRLRTNPVAVKVLKKSDEFPASAKRPIKDFGIKIAICQAIAMARIFCWTIAIEPEENTCTAASILFGWIDLKHKRRDDNIFTELAKAFTQLGYLKDVYTAMKSIEAIPKLKIGESKGLVFSPLATTKIVPDLVIMYCDSAQAMNLVHGCIFKEGGGLNFPCQARSSCVESIIPTILTGNPQMTIPCSGDRAYGMTDDSELIFTVPAKRIGDVIQLLIQRQKKGEFILPVYRNLVFQPVPSAPYRKLEKRVKFT